MASLILLNGPPASGKSTLANLLAEERATMLNLDIDVIRSGLADWPSDPLAAGLEARRVALGQARTHLQAGGDVVIPQFLGRLEFIEQLETLATQLQVPFVEVALQIERDQAALAFHRRTAAAANQTHRDAALLVEGSPSDDPLGDMFDALERVVRERSATRRVVVVPDDIEQTLAGLVDTLGV